MSFIKNCVKYNKAKNGWILGFLLLGLGLLLVKHYKNLNFQDNISIPEKAGDLIPQFSLKELNGIKYQYGLNLNKKSIVVFWASWCPPCAQETPALINYAIKHTDWEILAISNDQSRDEMMQFLKIFSNIKQPNIHILWDPNREVSEKFGVSGLPESFIVGEDHRLIKKMVGAVDWDQMVIP